MKNNFEFVELSNGSLSDQDLFRLISMARESEEGVYRFNLHKSLEDKLQEMLICFFNRSQSDVHKHLDKDEVITLIDGIVEVQIFDEEFNELENQKLTKSGLHSFIRIEKGCWHKVNVVSEYTIIHEITTGPFDKTKMIRKPNE